MAKLEHIAGGRWDIYRKKPNLAPWIILAVIALVALAKCHGS